MKADNNTLISLCRRDYYGQILHGQYSKKLKRRVAECILIFREFDRIGTLAIPYIAAWHEEEKVIWYEFVSRRFARILGTEYSEAAETFRNSILERRIYKSLETDWSVKEEVLSNLELEGSRRKLRKEVKDRGIVEAVYKSSTHSGEVYWFKDQATVESFEEDRISLSLGYLTLVSNEMEADDARKRAEEELRKSEEKFRNLAIHDDLTGLYNTRYLYKALDELIEHSYANSQAFSLIFMDLDNFKQVVDTYGHLNASKAIQEVGSTIKCVLSEPAYCVAYAGDEFIAVLPGFSKIQALKVAKTIQSQMRQTVYLAEQGYQVSIRASFGVATFPDDGTNQTELLAFADQEMFNMKEKKSDVQCNDNEVVYNGSRFMRTSEENQEVINPPVSKQIQHSSIFRRTDLCDGNTKESGVEQGSDQSVVLHVEADSYPKIRLHFREKRGDKHDELKIDVSLPKKFWVNLSDVCRQTTDSLDSYSSGTLRKALNWMSQRIMAEIELEDKRILNKEEYEILADTAAQIFNRADLDKARKGQMIHDLACRLKLRL
ncbi:MAG: GGDEF domain-containing protein [Syntrophobacterales bacterium]|jgi:diguanylate cyclase (GGDEF)-like protein